ncbi:Hpt domain-containing protein [Devosia sp. 2618]|uniref:Hpt domain-containing protein n=1 Tax=Devosia sp. 2618 TaxID=3156454 RepID=UPI0033911A84
MAQNSAKVENLDEISKVRPSRPIDLVHLAKQCLGDEHLEYEILRLFDTTMKIYMERLQASEAQADIVMNLHAIKGAASGVGAWTIADQAKACEDELHADRPLTPERIADLGMAVEEVGTFITRMLSNEPA